MPTGKNIASEMVELLDPLRISEDFSKRIAKGAPKLLVEEGKRLGFTLVTDSKMAYGLRHTVRAIKAIEPPKGETGTPISEASFEIQVHNLIKSRSKEQAAIVSVTVRAGNNVETRDMLMHTTDGNFVKAKEYIVTDNKVVLAHSWWTSTQKCIKSNCTMVCIAALLTCTGTWSAYLACLAVTCGTCWVKCAACVGCNCKWWCKWATGCCKQ
jgi:hypothetical protein